MKSAKIESTDATQKGCDAAAASTAEQLVKPASFYDGQIYRLDDDGTGKPRHFSVAPMVEFASRNLEVEFVRPDPDRAARMLKDGVVKAEYVLELTSRECLAPITLCLGAGKSGGDIIIDGNHRYVAWTLAAHERGLDIGIPAYRLEREHWCRFIVPDELVTKMGLYEPSEDAPESAS